MVILLYLYKLGVSLPKNFTKLYHHFISVLPFVDIFLNSATPLQMTTNLSDFPEPYNRIIQGLSNLSLKALNDNKLTFTLDDITAACSDIATIPGAINGFGLLQAVQYFGLHVRTMTLNFVHTLYNTRVPCCSLYFSPSTK